MSRVARVMVERLGQANAERLTALAGGTRVSIPGGLTGTSHHSGKLRERVGDELFVLLVLHFGASRIYVPRMAQTGPVDAREVARLTKRNWSASRIARKLGCSERTVYAKRAETKARSTSKGPKS